jgi:serine/threonine protein kinase
MAQGTERSRVVGDYLVGRQIGSGSFSVVWHARHRVHMTEVAIKEIATGRLNKKLQESLMSEIYILKQINHANIIHLHDIIEVCGFYFFLCYHFIFYFLLVSETKFLFGCVESGGKICCSLVEKQ